MVFEKVSKMVSKNSKRVIRVRFYGDRDLLHSLMAAGTLTPERIRGEVLFRLTDIKALADRMSELETVLEEIRDRVSETVGRERDGEA